MEINRRMLLSGIAAALAGSTVAAARPRRRFFDRVKLPIGLQLYTLAGQDRIADLDAMFAQVAAIGYRSLELPNLIGYTPAQWRAAADKAGLQLSSLHMLAMPGMEKMGLSLLSEPQKIADDLGILGVRDVALPIAPFPSGFRPAAGGDMSAAIGRAFAEAGADHWKRTAEMLNQRGAVLRGLGVTLSYHNHNVEFAPAGGTTGFEILARETDPKLLQFEVDTGWIAAAGLDPVAFFDRHRGRVRSVHVKDVASTANPNFALSMSPANVGSGKIDWARVLPAAHRAGARLFFLEQEPPFPTTRIEAAEKGHAFLASLKA